MDKITVIGDDVVSCVETYTLDAKTREMTSVKTVYTYEDGTVEEGIATITRDVEAPEGAKPFLAYAQETENLRTVTIVSNPGAENEKTESIQVPKGLQVGVSADFAVEETGGKYFPHSAVSCHGGILHFSARFHNDAPLSASGTSAAGGICGTSRK
jgi:hypothetical protein